MNKEIEDAMKKGLYVVIAGMIAVFTIFIIVIGVVIYITYYM